MMNAAVQALFPRIRAVRQPRRSVEFIDWKPLSEFTPPSQVEVLVRSQRGWGIAMFFEEDDLVSEIWSSTGTDLGDYLDFAQP